MQLSEYQQEVRRKVGLAPTDTAALPDAAVTSAINEGLKFIASIWEWYWLYAEDIGTISAGDNTVPVPEGYLRTIAFTPNGRAALSEQAYASLVDPDGWEDLPTSFALAGPNFVLWPMPDQAESYKHVYYRSEPELSGPTDEPLLPDAYSPWLVAEAALRVPFRTNSPEKFTVLREEVAEWRRNAKEEARRNLNAQPRRIRRTKQSIWSEV